MLNNRSLSIISSKGWCFLKAVSLVNRRSYLVYILMILTAHAQEKKSYDKNTSNVRISNETLNSGSMYVGLVGGVDFGKSNISTNGTTTNGNIIAAKSNLSHEGISGGVVLGYGKIIKSIYLGGEISGELSNNNKQSTFSSMGAANNDIKLSIRNKDKISAAVLIGKQIDRKTLIYAKGGVSSNHYVLKSSITSEDVGMIDSASSSRNVRVLHPIVGIGARRQIMKLTPNSDLHISAEYERTFERTTNVNLSSDTAVGRSQFKTSSNALKAKILIAF